MDFGNLLGALGGFFGTVFAPVTFLFHYIFFQPVFNVLMLIFQGVHSFGISIILLTLLIRGSLFPLTRKQLASSRRMQEIAPKVKALQAQYRGDNAGLMAAQQALYKEHGVSMYGGCLPLLIQMPFLYALYYSFYQVLDTKGNVLKAINDLIYPFLPHLTAVPNASFLGFSLIAPSVWLAAVAGVLTFVQMRMSLPVTPPGNSGTPDTTQQTAKTMQYIMPFFTFFIGTRFPAGLALYWAISTGFSAVQQYFITGWGSLWVGVPGMERFVPKPAISAPAVAVSSPASARRNGATGAAPATPPAGGAGFLAGLRARYREIVDQAQAQAAADRSAAEGRGSGEPAASGGDRGEGDDAEETQATPARKPTGGARDRRPRGSRSGAVLVRTSSEPAARDLNPEARIAAENSGDAPASDDLPEKRIARENALASSSLNGVKNVNGNVASRSATKNGSGNSSGRNGQNGARGRPQSGARNRSRGSR